MSQTNTKVVFTVDDFRAEIVFTEAGWRAELTDPDGEVYRSETYGSYLMAQAMVMCDPGFEDALTVKTNDDDRLIAWNWGPFEVAEAAYEREARGLRTTI